MIGIFGGTFDPVHYGHLKPAQDIMQDLGLTKILFVPNRVPPHRQLPVLDETQRVSLLKLALQDYPGFELDLREIEREGLSYMVITLASIKQDYADETLCLILGMDAFLNIDQWYEWRDLFSYCHIVVTARPGFDLPANLDAFLQDKFVVDENALRKKTSGKILIKSVSLLPVSATEIREKVVAGESLQALMPDKVVQQFETVMRKP